MEAMLLAFAPRMSRAWSPTIDDAGGIGVGRDGGGDAEG